MSKTLNEELDLMADEVNKAREAKNRNPKVIRKFLTNENFWLTALTVGIIGGVIFGIFKLNKFLDEQDQSRVDKQARVQEYYSKHWANVLMVIHPKDATRAAEIINEVDKPNSVVTVHEPFKKFENRGFVVTGELEEILKNKNIRYQREEFRSYEQITDFLGSERGARLSIIEATKPWVNW